jgi:hypothetical protein
MTPFRGGTAAALRNTTSRERRSLSADGCGLGKTPKGEQMTVDVIRHFLLGCTVINYGILLAWFLVFRVRA